jgi:DNA helicase-2/ATP-dependent DNA helicase PcrA
VSAALARVLDRSGYLQDLREERSEDAEARVENLAELVSAAREFETREAEPSLGAFVDRLSLLSDVDEEAGAPDARVLLMTLHSAKGLEFPAVIITGLEEGLFPHARSVDEETELEEELRLCYVGMTRAESRLVLSGAARRRVFGETPTDRRASSTGQPTCSFAWRRRPRLFRAGSTHGGAGVPPGQPARRGGGPTRSTNVGAYSEDSPARAVRARVRHRASARAPC